MKQALADVRAFMLIGQPDAVAADLTVPQADQDTRTNILRIARETLLLAKRASSLPGTMPLRARLMLEELGETLDGMGSGRVEEFADGLADLCYVVIGTAVSYGIPLDRVWRAVQDANMAKFPGGVATRDAGGKVLKPPSWRPPDIGAVLFPAAPVPGVDDNIGFHVAPVRYSTHGRETIDRIRDALGDEGFVAYCQGTAMKYLDRLGLKGDASEDAAKARWYTEMAQHVLGMGPDPRRYREGFAPYVRQAAPQDGG